MDMPLPLKALSVMRLGVGITAVVAPSSFALAFGRPSAEARTPLATTAFTFFGIRELALTAAVAGASATEPRALRRILLVGAVTDALDLALVGIRAIREPSLRRPVLMFAPMSVVSVALHLRAAQKIEVGP